MSADPDINQTVPAADAWAERKLAILSELAEAGLEIALALKARIVETTAAEPDAGNAKASADLARAFDRTSRAVRLSVALRDRLVKDAAAEPKPDSAREDRRNRAERVRRIVRRIARARYRDGYTRESLDRQTTERLFDPDITGDLEGRSIGELVARICADLGLPPRWLTLAQEAWAQAEITERPAGSPYAAWPDLPPEDPDPEDDDADDWDDDDDPEDEDEPDDPAGSDP